MPQRKPSTPKRTPSRRTVLRLWSKVIRTRWGKKCAVCGSERYVQAHHLVDKRFAPYQICNGICLCPTCHKWGNLSAHCNPVWFTDWISEHHPALLRWCLDWSDFAAKQKQILPVDYTYEYEKLQRYWQRLQQGEGIVTGPVEHLEWPE